MLTRDQCVRAVAWLGAAHDRIATAMYTVDSHAAWPKLGSATTAGQTRARGERLRTQVDRLWASFATFGEHVELARTLLAGRPSEADLGTLAALLTAPVVGLDAAGLPVEVTGATSAYGPTGTVATRVTLEQLAVQTEAGATTVLGELSEVDKSWSAMAGQYLPVDAELEALATLAAEVGEPQAVSAARAAVAQVDQLDLHDPLTAAPGGVLAPATRERLAVVQRQLATARESLTGLAAARDGYPQARAALAELIDRVAAAQTATAQTYARVVARIAEPGLAPLPGSTAGLVERLRALDDLHGNARWGALAQELAALQEQAAQDLADAARLAQIADGLLARRDELRGRLSAYRAKANALGLAEDEALTALHTTAHELLYSAPCDLRAATRAVAGYAAALSGAGAPGHRPAPAMLAEGEDR